MLVSLLINHFTDIDGYKAGVDLVLMQPFPLSHLKLVGIMLTSTFQA